MDTKKILFAFFISVVAIVACKKETTAPMETSCETGTTKYGPNLPSQEYDYASIQFPSYFFDNPLLDLFNTLEDENQVTNAGATLGRVLFYDTQLSVNNSVSCASCHSSASGFSDPNQFSVGFNNELSDRNSMAIINVNFQRRFFWDNRSNSIEQQVLMPIEHPEEMGMNLEDLPNKLAQMDYYPVLFENAFGDDTINNDLISKALSQFLKSIRSFDSKYDQGIDNNFSNFTPTELAGKELWFSGEHSCVNCHMTPNFGGVSSHVNGLVETPIDLGVGGITGNEAQMGEFKSVSLRNIELTAPYMHDGRFATLEDVLNFYSTDIQAHPYLDDRLTSNHVQGGIPEIMNLTDSQKEQYIAFLKTLTDWNLINNPWYSNPFPE